MFNVTLPDAVDNGQNKKAIQLADKILKKQDDLQCARVCQFESSNGQVAMCHEIFSPVGFEGHSSTAHGQTGGRIEYN